MTLGGSEEANGSEGPAPDLPLRLDGGLHPISMSSVVGPLKERIRRMWLMLIIIMMKKKKEEGEEKEKE